MPWEGLCIGSCANSEKMSISPEVKWQSYCSGSKRVSDIPKGALTKQAWVYISAIKYRILCLRLNYLS